MIPSVISSLDKLSLYVYKVALNITTQRHSPSSHSHTPVPETAHHTIQDKDNLLAPEPG